MSHPRRDASHIPTTSYHNNKNNKNNKINQVWSLPLPPGEWMCMCAKGGSILNYPLTDLNSLHYPEILPCQTIGHLLYVVLKTNFPLDMLWCSTIWGPSPPVQLLCATGTISGPGRVTSSRSTCSCASATVVALPSLPTPTTLT